MKVKGQSKKGGDEIMSRNCIKCGAEIRDTEVFCPKCGTVQNAQVVNNSFNSNPTKLADGHQSNGSGSNNKKYMIIGAVVALILVVGVVLISFGGNNEEKDANKGTAQETTTTSTVESDAVKTQPASPSNPATAKAEKELWQKGVQGTVVASSKGHSNNGYVSLVNNNGQYQIVTYDTKNGRVGTTPYARNILYFTDKKPTSGGNEIIIFNLTVLNDTHDNDNNAGVWEGANHNIPVYAAYKFDGSGNLVPGMLTTGKGAKPSHYHEYFYETRNVDTINLFLTEMMALQKNIADNKVVLP